MYVHAGDMSRSSWQSSTDQVLKSRTHHPTRALLWGAINSEGDIIFHWCDNLLHFYSQEKGGSSQTQSTTPFFCCFCCLRI